MLSTVVTCAIAWTVASAMRCPPGEIFRGKSCSKCPIGTYRASQTPFMKGMGCAPCPAGTFQPNLGVPGRSLCRPCYPGTFSARPGATKCTPCPGRTVSLFSATKCSKCAPGTRPRLFGTGCTRCPRGTYSNAVVNQGCKLCPPGTMTKDPGAKSISACRPCPPGNVSSRCSPCLLNQYRPVGTSACKPCPHGTVSGHGSTSIADCVKCRMGTARSPSGYYCEKCRRGRVTNGPGAIMCKPADKPCPLDHFKNSHGDCHQCEVGFILNVKTLKCEICPDGTVSKGGLETKCERCMGTMVPREGFPDKCLCPPGQFPAAGGCRKCRPGTATWVSSIYGPVCTPCRRGWFADKPGMAVCKICPLGLVSFEEGAARCRKCPKGLIPRVATISDVSSVDPFGFFNLGDACISPRTGCPTSAFYQKYGDFASIPGCLTNVCLANNTQKDAGRTCVTCPPGQVPESDGRYCESCRTYEVSDGSVGAKCKKCANGLLRDIDDMSTCTCRGVGVGMMKGKCVKCPPGMISEQGSTKCVPCEVGTFTSRKGEEKCRPCKEYSFAPGRGNVNCKACPAKGVPDKRFGATKCDAVGR